MVCWYSPFFCLLAIVVFVIIARVLSDCERYGEQ